MVVFNHLIRPKHHRTAESLVNVGTTKKLFQLSKSITFLVDRFEQSRPSLDAILVESNQLRNHETCSCDREALFSQRIWAFHCRHVEWGDNFLLRIAIMLFSRSRSVSLTSILYVVFLFASSSQNHADADEFDRVWIPFLKQNCIDCHDGSDTDRADFSSLDVPTPSKSFARWERIFDRVNNGEMPPASVEKPDVDSRNQFLGSLKNALTSESQKQQRERGRVILRRLSPLEYKYTLNDLLGIQAELRSIIPSQSASSTFDTVAASQGFGPLHAKKFLEAAELAMERAIRLDPKPTMKKRRIEMKKHRLVRKHIDTDDHVVIGETDSGIILFSNASYILKLPDIEIIDGKYLVRAKASSFQSEGRPAVLTLNSGDWGRGYQEVFGHFDVGRSAATYEATTHLDRGQYLFPGVADLHAPEDNSNIWNVGPEKYKGAGVEIEWVEIQGPLVPTWPPPSTTELFKEVSFEELEHPRWDKDRQQDYQFVIKPQSDSLSSHSATIRALAKRAFRRPVDEAEIRPFVQLGETVLNDGRNLTSAVTTSAKALFTSPDFLFFFEKPGPLDDYSLAARLSYFLWKTMPDERLQKLASNKELAQRETLLREVERMLDDPRSVRFVEDFLDQWLRLSEIDSTSPDERLYPEFDPLLKMAMLAETRHYFRHMISKDIGTDALIDSEFTFVNRRLAEHYRLEGVQGEHFRKIRLPENSVRGGLITQASVLKVTANGTVTSPVRRGSWVLSHLLGKPPSPPPPNVGSIEPDTRGSKTIRELLEKHRDDSSCATCHRDIDPPGFAMESFDVIGGLRTRYRHKEIGERPKTKWRGRNIWEYKLGLEVDSSGQFGNDTFTGIIEFKKLLRSKRRQVARNVIEKLLVYSTGAEIQFADREVVEDILHRSEQSDFGLRTIIREVIVSSIFLNK